MITVRNIIWGIFLTFYASSASALDVPPEAFAVGAVDEGNPRAETRLIVDRAAVEVGEEFRVGILFDLDPEWHVYGADPGEAGLPTSIIWKSDGAQVGDTLWPTTESFLDPSGRIETTGYSERVVLESDATVTALGEMLRLTAEVDYLACRIKCLPGSARLVRDIPIGTSQPAGDQVLALFDNFGRTRPAAASPSLATQALSAPATASKPPAPAPVPIWQAMLLALLGGVLLNLMPCVFPVLALKVFGFVSTSAHRPTALRHSAAYAAGIVVSMLVLAGVVVAAKIGGEAVGWGFQFQEPGYLVALTLFVVLFALNLFGVFDVQTLPLPSRGGSEVSVGRSFVDGGLAVVLATPCSAPFLGTAVGFALASSSPVIVATFVAVGLGLALPFVIACAIPAIGRRLPKPGPWMEHLERVLGFVLLATAVWLVWVFGRVAGVDGIAALLACAVSAALGVWIFGRVQYEGGRHKAAGALAALTLAIAPLAVLTPWAFEAPTAQTAASARWQPWDDTRIAKEQAAGRVVFVDFTADWCITCKVNERVALSSDELWQMFAEKNVVAMKADWTKRDEKIRAALASFGRGGVPMYLVYPADGGEPELLPEVLTESLVRAAIDRNLRDRDTR